MTDSRLVIANCLAFTSKEIRDEVFPHLQRILEFARNNEPGTLKYAICLPDDATDESTIYIFEEFADTMLRGWMCERLDDVALTLSCPRNSRWRTKDLHLTVKLNLCRQSESSLDIWRFSDTASFDKHMSSKPIQDLLDLGNDVSQLRPEYSHRRLAYVPGALLSRSSRLPNAEPSTDRVDHPFIIWATITDPQPADIDALEPYGAAVVKYAQENEPDTVFYADLKLVESEANLPKADFIAALEVYASKEACFAHLKNPAVQALKTEGVKLESTFKIVMLNMVEGFLTR